MSRLVTCDAHAALAETIFCDGSPHTDELGEVKPACLVQGLEYVYDDGSALVVPDDGEATVEGCNCPGDRVTMPHNRPDGFTPWSGPPIGAPIRYVCDVCGMMCECCDVCGIGCVCDD